MAVFDDPNRELDRLQRQLLAEEEENLEDILEEYGEEDYDTLFEEDYEEETREPLYRNHANGYGADIRNFANGYRGEALIDEEDDRHFDYDDYVRGKKRSGVGRFLLILLLLGIAVAAAGKAVGVW